MHAAVFLVVFMLAGMALNLFVRAISAPPYMGLLSDKLSDFTRYKDDVDILFVGTSRTFRQINAPLIEQDLKKRGCGRPMVFNMGIPNLTFTELDYVLGEIYKMNPARLKLVILDEPMPAVRPELGRLRSDRIRYFSGWNGTFSRLNDIWTSQETLRTKILRAGVALIGFGYETASIGHLSRIVFPALYLKNSESDPEAENMPKDWLPTRGYFLLEEPGHVNDVIEKGHQAFMRDIAKFEAVLEAQKKEPPRSSLAPSTERIALYGSYFDLIKAGGRQAGLFLPPLPERVGEHRLLAAALKEKYTDLALLDYNDPQAQGEYWDADLWFDDGHLNDRGSAMLSAEIVQRLCPLTKEWGR